MKAAASAMVALFFSAQVLAGIDDLGPATCGELANAYGPFDYRVDRSYSRAESGEIGSPRQTVEPYHFTPQVESLQRGRTATTPGPDIDYTLRAIPNHHRALLAMMNLGFKEKKDKPLGSRYTVECWMERAERWRPDDEIVKILFGTYLLRVGRREEARVKLEAADKLVARKEAYSVGPNAQYNLGLAFFQLGDYARSLAYAHKAYAQNYPLPGLRDKLKRAGRWQDAKPETQASAQAPDASSPR